MFVKNVQIMPKGSALMTTAELMNERERKTLSPFATLSSETKGRDFPIEPCFVRTEFQRDRDRITHCKAFRRQIGRASCRERVFRPV